MSQNKAKRMVQFDPVSSLTFLAQVCSCQLANFDITVINYRFFKNLILFFSEWRSRIRYVESRDDVLGVFRQVIDDVITERCSSRNSVRLVDELAASDQQSVGFLGTVDWGRDSNQVKTE